MPSAILVEINLDHGLKTQLCIGAEQTGEMGEGARYESRECKSKNGIYMSHLKGFQLKRKK